MTESPAGLEYNIVFPSIALFLQLNLQEIIGEHEERRK